jgi:hypothetical protein
LRTAVGEAADDMALSRLASGKSRRRRIDYRCRCHAERHDIGRLCHAERHNISRQRLRRPETLQGVKDGRPRGGRQHGVVSACLW